MLKDEEVKQIVDAIGQSIADGDKYNFIGALCDYLTRKNMRYPVQEYKNELPPPWDFFNSDLVNEVKRTLNDKHVVFLCGEAGNGKTSLAKYITYEYTGYVFDYRHMHMREEEYYDRACYHVATDGLPVYYNAVMNNGLLNKYIDYIQQNNITEPCVFICDEIQSNGLMALFGDLYRNFDNPKYLKKHLPDNLYIILVGLNTSVNYGRVTTYYVSGLCSRDTEVHEKFLEKFRTLKPDADKILEIAEYINDNCYEPMIKNRSLIQYFFGVAKGLKIRFYDEKNLKCKERVDNGLKELRSLDLTLIEADDNIVGE